MTDITFKLTAATNVGLIRSNNEDNFIVCPNLDSKSAWFVPDTPDQTLTLSKNGALFVVADGMGGMNAGEVASAIAIETVQEMFSQDDYSSIINDDNKICKYMKRVVEKADRNIKDRVKRDSSTEGMGTTIVMGWVIGCRVHICWCGDSRAYLFNPQVGLKRLSKDHSYVQQLVDEGKLDPELAFDHPNSNIITRSLGDSSQKAMPDYMSQRLSSGDIILLCSDGLCGLCDDPEILEVLSQEAESIDDIKNRLITAALNAGGHDNVTLTLFQVVHAPEATSFGMQTHAEGLTSKRKETAASVVAEEPKEVEPKDDSSTQSAEIETTKEAADKKVETPDNINSTLEPKKKQKRSKGRGCFITLAILLILVAAAYMLRAELQPIAEKTWAECKSWVMEKLQKAEAAEQAEEAVDGDDNSVAETEEVAEGDKSAVESDAAAEQPVEAKPAKANRASNNGKNTPAAPAAKSAPVAKTAPEESAPVAKTAAEESAPAAETAAETAPTAEESTPAEVVAE